MKNVDTFSLNGRWKFLMDPEDIGKKKGFHASTYDDGDWGSIQVPSFWQVAGYPNYSETSWYRRRFKPPFKNVETILLEFKAVSYFSEVWLNDVKLGEHEGYFAPFKYDVTGILKEENVIVVKASAPLEPEQYTRRQDFREKSKVMGALQDWDCCQYPCNVNPAGIWQDVRLIVKSDPWIEDVNFETMKVEGAKAYISVEVTMISKQDTDVTLETHLAPKNFNGDVIELGKHLTHVKKGKTLYSFTSTIHPRFWWSWDLGEPDLYNLEATLGVKGRSSVTYTRPVGVRTIAKGKGDGGDRYQWALYLNNVRFFARGCNYLSDKFPSRVTEERYRRDLSLMKEANMNMVRCFANVEKDVFYDVCDGIGVMVYQDFPLQWRYTTSGDLVPRAVRVAEDMVLALRHHPSIVLWCCHSEPHRKENFDVLDRLIEKRIKELDETRPVIPENGTNWGGTADLHFYWGWFSPDMSELEKNCERAGFVSEFGVQAVPNYASLIRFIPEKYVWPPDDREVNLKIWNRYNYRMHLYNVNEALKPKNSKDIHEFIAKTQSYQAKLLKFYIECLRRHKFNPINGALLFHFKDCLPAVTDSIIDYYYGEKEAYGVIKESFNPLHIMMEWPESPNVSIRKGCRVYVVNDFKDAFNCMVEWLIISAEGQVKERERRKFHLETKSAQVVGLIKASEECRVELFVYDYKGKRLSNNQYTVRKEDLKLD